MVFDFVSINLLTTLDAMQEEEIRLNTNEYELYTL